MPKQSLYKSAAFKKLMAGVDKLSDAVCSTLGPSGRNVIIERAGDKPIVSKDGVTVAMNFDLEDPVERMGAVLVREAAQRTNKGVGDGTTTATLLAREFVKKLGSLGEEIDVHDVRRSMSEYVEKVCAWIDEKKVKVESLEQLRDVSTISANNDAALGELVSDVVWRAGKNGVVTIEESSGTEIETEVVDGFQIDKGFTSPYQMTSPERGEALFNDAPVLVTDKRLSSISDILPIMEKVATSGGKQLVIIADDVEGDALGTIVANKLRAGFSTLAIKAPGFGDQRQEMLRDLAVALGATLISDETGKRLNTIEVEDFGSAKKIVATKDKTTFIGGAGDKEEVKGRVKKLEDEMDACKSDYEREKLKERYARLTGGVAVIRVGAHSESEMREKKFLIEDAVNAAKAALADGIVAGGGMTLFRAASEVEQDSVIASCLSAPLRKILENAGVKEIPKSLLRSPSSGYDAKKREWVEDMVAAGIIDPALAAKETLRNAASVAALFLTTDCVLYDRPEKKTKPVR